MQEPTVRRVPPLRMRVLAHIGSEAFGAIADSRSPLPVELDDWARSAGVAEPLASEAVDFYLGRLNLGPPASAAVALGQALAAPRTTSAIVMARVVARYVVAWRASDGLPRCPARRDPRPYLRVVRAGYRAAVPPVEQEAVAKRLQRAVKAAAAEFVLGPRSCLEKGLYSIEQLEVLSQLPDRLLSDVVGSLSGNRRLTAAQLRRRVTASLADAAG